MQDACCFTPRSQVQAGSVTQELGPEVRKTSQCNELPWEGETESEPLILGEPGLLWPLGASTLPKGEPQSNQQEGKPSKQPPAPVVGRQQMNEKPKPVWRQTEPCCGVSPSGCNPAQSMNKGRARGAAGQRARGRFALRELAGRAAARNTGTGQGSQLKPTPGSGAAAPLCAFSLSRPHDGSTWGLVLCTASWPAWAVTQPGAFTPHQNGKQPNLTPTWKCLPLFCCPYCLLLPASKPLTKATDPPPEVAHSSARSAETLLASVPALLKHPPSSC